MIGALAKLLGLSRTQTEESLYSERAARHVLSRRSAIGLGAAMAAGSLFKFGTPDPFDGYEFRIGVYGHIVCGVPGWIPIVSDTVNFFGLDRVEVHGPTAVVTGVDRLNGIITVSG